MKTAVDFLVEEINKLTGLNISMDETCVEQAKEMENKQKHYAYQDGKEDVFDWLKKMDYDFLVEQINKTE